MTCPTCGEPLDAGVSKCPKCSPVLKVGSDHLGIKVNPVGTVVATPPDHPGGTRVDYRPPSGGRSLSQADPGGTFTADLSKGLVSGTKNEHYVVGNLAAALQARGHKISLVGGAKDDRGEDQFIVIDGEQFIIQVVTMPSEDGVWRTLNTQRTFTQAGDRDSAVEWMRAALLKKQNAKGAIVVLDALHITAVVGPALVDAYLAVHRKPVDEFGFKDAWIVGSTASFSFRIA